MSLVTNTSSLALWQEVIKNAEDRCAIALKEELEAYLIALLMRYVNKPELVKQVFANAFLEAMKLQHHLRKLSLQNVGDQCLLFAGLFPRLAERRHVKITYFVDIGRTAYSAVSDHGNDLFGSLAMQFVLLMDVLQSIRHPSDMLPLEAYTQWQELGSQRAYKVLQEYTQGIPYIR